MEAFLNKESHNSHGSSKNENTLADSTAHARITVSFGHISQVDINRLDTNCTNALSEKAYNRDLALVMIYACDQRL